MRATISTHIICKILDKVEPSDRLIFWTQRYGKGEGRFLVKKGCYKPVKGEHFQGHFYLLLQSLEPFFNVGVLYRIGVFGITIC